MLHRGDTKQVHKCFTCLPGGLLQPLDIVAKQAGRVRGKTAPYKIFWVYIYKNLSHE